MCIYTQKKSILVENKVFQDTIHKDVLQNNGE